MEFDWAEDKRRKNLAKHSLDFADVPLLDWEAATLREDNRTDYGERRYWAYGLLHGRLHLVVFTVRGTKFRIISFRRANRREVERYGKA
ncbi:MAG: BrnT family toxin [Rhodospirillaceae bacterium]|nr:MAG: BrnT family toxin [Rhodospirillaceae bacterium]